MRALRFGLGLRDRNLPVLIGLRQFRLAGLLRAPDLIHRAAHHASEPIVNNNGREADDGARRDDGQPAVAHRTPLRTRPHPCRDRLHL